MRKIICNQNGHGYIPSKKDLLKLGLVLCTFPVSLPILIIRAEIKKKLKERKERKR